MDEQTLDPLILRQLTRLNRSSPDFPGWLNYILCRQDYEESVPTLQDSDLMWLVDYLNEVRLQPPTVS